MYHKATWTSGKGVENMLHKQHCIEASAKFQPRIHYKMYICIHQTVIMILEVTAHEGFSRYMYKHTAQGWYAYISTKAWGCG